MATPAYDFTVRKGNSGTVQNSAGLVFRLRDSEGNPLDPTGRTYVFFAKLYGDEIVKLSSADSEITVVAETCKITVPLETDTFANVTPGAPVRYEVEDRSATEQITRLAGKITIEAGLNDD